MTVSTEEVNTQCKWGPLKAPCCQKLANPKILLLCVAFGAIIQGMLVNGFVNVGISSIEKRFNLPSRDSGLVAASYDIATVICLLPVGYFGGQGSKPRWIGFGYLILSFGALVYSLPHFITGKYSANDASDSTFCNELKEDCSQAEDTLSNYKYVLILGQFLHGIGATPTFTLGLVYLHENLHPDDSAFYMGILFMLFVTGPAIGYIIGAFFVGIYTDFDQVGSDEITIDEDSDAWVGAWWLGPLMCTVLFIIAAIPMLGLPERLPGWEKLEGLRNAEVHKGMDEVVHKNTGLKSLKDFPKAMWVLLQNPVFIFVSLAGASDAFLVSGFSTFMPKYTEVQFSVTPSTAALMTGGIVLICGGGGAFLGGFIIKKAHLNVPGMLKFCIAVSVITLVAGGSILLNCKQPDFAGVSVDFNGNKFSSISSKNGEDLQDTCNTLSQNCSCDYNSYKPVCGDDSVTYINPCVAGCQENMEASTFHNCTCVGGSATVEDGLCDKDCKLFYAYVPLVALLIFFTFISYMPIVPITLRSVPEAQRSLSMSAQDVIIRPLGSVPGPIAFGAVFDATCLFWLIPKCGDSSACYYYDNAYLSYYLTAVAVGVKSLTIIFFILALFLYKPPPQDASNGESMTRI